MLATGCRKASRGEERKNEITKADFDKIAAMGFDHVRIPIDEVQLWDSRGNKDKEGFALLHNGINWALANKLRVIVDLHIIRSYSFDAAKNPLWTDEAEQHKLINLWERLSDELHQYPNNMVAYEILNEVAAPDPDEWNGLYNKVIAAIRAKEPKRIIVIGSNKWQIPATFPDLKIPESDPNLVLSFHFYIPLALTHHTASWSGIAEYTGPVNYPGQIVDPKNYKGLSQATIDKMESMANGYFDKAALEKIMEPAIKVAKEHKLPLYCGEFGIYPRIPEEPKLRWYKDVCDICRENNIAYCHWCYKGDFPVVKENGEPDPKLVPILTAR